MTEPLAGAAKVSEVISRERLLHSADGVASWLLRSSQQTGKTGKSHRLAVYSYEREVTWLYPNSNTAESIGAWLDLAQMLNRPQYVQFAVDYASTLIDDKVKGLYSGPEAAAHGMMWYWTDAGTYSSLYSMRVPAQFMRIHALTGEQRYLDMCEVIGRVLVNTQEKSGIVASGWSPQNGWAETGTHVGCRFMYTIGSFAKLWELTGSGTYRDAYERAVQGLLRMQNADGSFYQVYNLQTLECAAVNDSIKCMFFAYLFNGIAEAYGVFKDERLLACAMKMADFVVRTYYCRSTLPYCIGRNFLPGDRPEANMASYECANGLLWLHSLVPDERYLDVAIRLWQNARLSQADRPDEPDIHGAILIGADPGASRHDAEEQLQRTHQVYSETRAAKCVLWCMVNHVFATRRLLEGIGS